MGVAVQIAYTVSGLAVGFIVGLTGVGGGSLMTPLLVIVFGINPATAVGTDLLYASITKSAGAWVHAKRGNVDWKLVGALGSGSVPAAIVTLAVLHFLGVDSKSASGVITFSLGIAILLTAFALLSTRSVFSSCSCSALTLFRSNVWAGRIFSEHSHMPIFRTFNVHDANHSGVSVTKLSICRAYNGRAFTHQA